MGTETTPLTAAEHFSGLTWWAELIAKSVRNAQVSSAPSARLHAVVDDLTGMARAIDDAMVAMEHEDRCSEEWPTYLCPVCDHRVRNGGSGNEVAELRHEPAGGPGLRTHAAGLDPRPGPPAPFLSRQVVLDATEAIELADFEAVRPSLLMALDQALNFLLRESERRPLGGTSCPRCGVGLFTEDGSAPQRCRVCSWVRR